MLLLLALQFALAFIGSVASEEVACSVQCVGVDLVMNTERGTGTLLLDGEIDLKEMYREMVLTRSRVSALEQFKATAEATIAQQSVRL
jgi:hypothetical protein